MRLIIVSGLSGSGKSVALHMLEDIDFYCVDNIPAALLKSFISHTIRGSEDQYPRTAVGLDARNRPKEIEAIPALVPELRRSGIACEVLYLHATDEVLLRRYAETRRKHPLVAGDVSLREAIACERKLLEPIAVAADWIIDTSNMGVHALRERLRERLAHRTPPTRRSASRARRPGANRSRRPLSRRVRARSPDSTRRMCRQPPMSISARRHKPR